MKSLSDQNVEIWGGIECTVNRVQDHYFDQLDQSGHRKRDEDIRLFADLGLKKMRYPIIWEHHAPFEKQAIEWSATEFKINELRDHSIEVIAGLVHHGSGPTYAPVLSEDFATGLAEYAGKVAEKFPWINYYTPVNEPLTTARFCGLYGVWHPHKKNDACFCRILVNECKATILAMKAIRSLNPNAQLVQTDDLAMVHSSSALAYQAAFENERRWLSFDLLCGKVNKEHSMWNYLTANHITEDELCFFREHPCPPNIIGLNYYLTSERFLDDDTRHYPAHTHGGNGRHFYADVEAVRVAKAKPAGLYRLLQIAWQRYGIPLAVTEVHLHCTREEQMRWLNESWLTAVALRAERIPILAITPWALLGSFDWDRLLTVQEGSYEPGVYDVSSGTPRLTILGKMIKTFSQNKIFKHPAIEEPGWWHRPCRVIYGEKTGDLKLKQGNYLYISGSRSALLAEVCRKRGLNYVQADEQPALLKTWARVEAGAYLEFKCPGKPDLAISFFQDVERALNSGLDLFLDGESGYWEIDERGTLCLPVPEVLPLLHANAS